MNIQADRAVGLMIHKYVSNDYWNLNAQWKVFDDPEATVEKQEKMTPKFTDEEKFLLDFSQKKSYTIVCDV